MNPSGPDSESGGPTERSLVGSNAVDAAARRLADFAVDVTAVTVAAASAAQIGQLNALRSIAFLVLGIPAGVWLDRWRPVRVVWVSSAVRTLAVLSVIVALSATDGISILQLYLVVFLLGVSVLFTETAQTVLSGMVAKDGQIRSLVSRMQAVDQAAAFVVPAVAGLAIVRFEVDPVLWTAALLTVVSAGILGQDRRSSSEKPVTVRASSVFTGFFSDARDGFRVIYRDVLLRRLTISAIFTNAGLAVFGAVEVIVVLRFFEFGPEFLGLMISAGAVGGLLGSAVAGRSESRVSDRHSLRLSAWLMPLAAAAVLAATASQEPWSRALMLGHAFIWGYAVLSGSVKSAAFVIDGTPTDLIGRVSASRRTLTMGIVPIGSITGGLIAEAAGIRAAIIIWLTLSIAAALFTEKALVAIE